MSILSLTMYVCINATTMLIIYVAINMYLFYANKVILYCIVYVQRSPLICNAVLIPFLVHGERNCHSQFTGKKWI